MTGEVIKSFLVGLGFSVDDKSFAAFNAAIKSSQFRIAALVGSIQLAAGGIFAAITHASKGFEDLGYQLRIVAPAMNRWLVMRQAMLQAYSRAGVNLTEVVQNAIKLNYSFAKTKFALEAIYKGTAARFFPLITKQLDVFRGKIFANMPKIQNQLQHLVEFIFKAFSATVELGERLWSILTRVWDFFVRLDQATNGWSTRILAVIAAWDALNLAFLATPLGALIAGLVTLLALFDDFEVWREKGKSLFDWGPFVPVINAVSDSIQRLVALLGDMFQILFGIGDVLVKVFTGQWQGAANALKLTFQSMGDSLKDLVNLKSSLPAVGSALLNWGGAAASWVGNHIPNGPLLSQVGQQGTPAQPLLAHGPQSSQNVSQQTSITVNGSADAHTVGKNVASQQDRVNYDMTRNLKGALQ